VQVSGNLPAQEINQDVVVAGALVVVFDDAVEDAQQFVSPHN
jgi:hypothetical protein